MFEKGKPRYATTGVISLLPGFLIDAFWMMIDVQLQGVFPLENILFFQLENNQGKLTIGYLQDGKHLDLKMDFPFPYSTSYPSRILAYDDGENQTILLPDEANNTF